jgi:hypothetical protein
VNPDEFPHTDSNKKRLMVDECSWKVCRKVREKPMELFTKQLFENVLMK